MKKLGMHLIAVMVTGSVLLLACDLGGRPSDLPSPMPTPPTIGPVRLREDFEAGLGNWQTGSDVPEDPNRPGQPVAWSITPSREQASEGQNSVRFVLDGVADDGTIWLVRSFDVPPDQDLLVNLAFDLWSESESFNTLAMVAAYAGPRPPEAEGDFDLSQPANLASGWRRYTYDIPTRSDPNGRVWVAVGISVVWETEVTYYVDNLQVEIQSRAVTTGTPPATSPTGQPTPTRGAESPAVAPPPALVEIASRQQISGIGTYCWTQPTGKETAMGVCADMVGIPTAEEPITTTSPFTAIFWLAPEEKPDELQLEVISVTAEDELSPRPAGQRTWSFRSGERYSLPRERQSSIELTLEPGQYVLSLYARWSAWGSVQYGFLVDVQAPLVCTRPQLWHTYTHPTYGFSFRYPPEWTVQEWSELPNCVWLRHRQRPDLVLSVGVRWPGEAVAIQRTGVGAGELHTEGSVVFLGQELSRDVLIYEGRTKAVLYHRAEEIDVGGLVFTLSLDDRRADYAAADIEPAVQAQVDQIIESFARLPLLRVDEHRIVSAEIDGPGHFEYTDRLGPSLLERIEGLRARAAEQKLARANSALAAFGYRLEVRDDPSWNRTVYDLVHEGEPQPLITGLSHFWPVSVNASGTEFILAAENAPNAMPPYLLVHADHIEPWEAESNAFLPPEFVGDALARVIVTGFPTLTIQVELDGQVVYQDTAVAYGAYLPLQNLTTWDGHWALELDDRLILDGQDLGQAMGYDAVFGFTLIRGHPFYFFEQGGRVRLSYAGRTLPNVYNRIFHNQCCEAAMHNVEFLEDMVLFHALWNGTWYWVEAGVYDGGASGTYRYTAPEGWSFRFPAHWSRLDEELGFVQDPATGKTVTFASQPTTAVELTRWLEAEIARKLAATEADNTLAEPLSVRSEGDLTVYQYAIRSRREGSETLLRTTVLFDGQRRYEFYAAIPPVTEEEYQAMIASFQPG